MKAIVLIGGPAHGFKAVGPFENRRAAIMWSALDSNAELEHCHVLNLEEPANDQDVHVPGEDDLKWTVEVETHDGWRRCQVWMETKERAEESLKVFRLAQPYERPDMWRLRQQLPGEKID